MKRSHGFFFGVLLSAAGFAELWYGTNRLAAALGLFTFLSYLLVCMYTPLKRRSAACTFLGAIPGAMPPLIGYAAAGAIDIGALALFLVLFTWQFPHFDAIAWMYRDDYARGGIRTLPVIEPDGESTATRVVGCSLLLIPISLLPSFLGMTGAVYGIAAVAAGFGLLYLARARALLLASVVYLPALFGVMALDRRVV
jgi:protoheme IX farnesyltransferase